MNRIFVSAVIGLALVLAAIPAPAQPLGGVRFHNFATAENGITYQREPSATKALADELRQRGVSDLGTLLLDYPVKSYGAPGVALLDYDGDGDLDLYVTNGPGKDNGLYRNRLAEDGHFALELVPGAAGAAATEQDSTGVCYGDIDNDGDPDLLVLSRKGPKHLFENQGGHFADVSNLAGSDIGRDTDFDPASCAMADVNGDGLLDIFVANTFDWKSKAAIIAEPWALNEYNQLFLNQGGNRFKDASAASGIQNFRDITWGVAMFDYDGDGDVDILTANDQGTVPMFRYGGFNRGFTRLYQNDGKGHFTDVTVAAGLTHPGDYMGFAVADFDGNGTLDFYVTNIGDWVMVLFGLPYATGDMTSRWLLNDGKGHFSDPGVNPELAASGWGWGASALDYDNDGDFDVVSYGGYDAGPVVERSNPRSLLSNDGHAKFRLDLAAYDGSIDAYRRNDHGVAAGDLNGDGFEDIVSVSDVEGAPFFPTVAYPFGPGGAYQGKASIIPSWIPQPDGTFKWSGVPLLPGTLAVELNSGGNGNNWVDVRTVGTVGIATGGHNNRDGIGAVVRLTRAGAGTASQPILGGSSHASEDSLLAHFGLGKARRGMVEVTWQGGVKNRLYAVQAGEKVRFPEIPCDFAIKWPSRTEYTACVDKALGEIQKGGLLTTAEVSRFRSSALLAYDQSH
jgi:enediyne biosynthesis protein E4